MEKLFYQIGNLGDIRPASKMADALLIQSQQGVEISNGHSRLVIPSQTFAGIKCLDLKTQERVRRKLANALQDASRIALLTPKK